MIGRRKRGRYRPRQWLIKWRLSPGDLIFASKIVGLGRFWKYFWGFTLRLRGPERLASLLIYTYTDNKRNLWENIKRHDLVKKNIVWYLHKSKTIYFYSYILQKKIPRCYCIYFNYDSIAFLQFCKHKINYVLYMYLHYIFIGVLISVLTFRTFFLLAINYNYKSSIKLLWASLQFISS